MYQKNEIVQYNKTIKAKVLDIHHDGDEPYYTIQLPDKEKQTDSSHLSKFPTSLFNRNYFRKKPSILFKFNTKSKSTYCDTLYTPPTPIYRSDSDSDFETIDLDSISDC
jgi:hypothetical protein